MHKKNFIPMLALMGLTALSPLAAQEQQPGVSPEAEGQQEMSQPTARSTSESSGLTLTGEVIAMDQQALRVRTATGVENVILTNRTDKAADVETGDQVRVDFTRSSQGVMIATQVRKLSGAEAGATDQPMSGSEVMGHAGHHDAAAASGSTATDTMGPTGATGPTGSTAGSTGSASSYDDQSASADTETGMESDTATAGTLPDTGSSLPLAGLAGLFALGVASVVRSLR